jgi:gamma-glutamyl hercynylcysteine S-oxide synthase
MRNARRADLVEELAATRDYTVRLFDQLKDQQWEVPYLPTINPPLWELGHIGWFQEYWCSRWRHEREPRGSILSKSDSWFSTDIGHGQHTDRWALTMPPQAEVREYLSDSLDTTLNALEHQPESDEGLYFHRLALFHEQLHVESLAHSWQQLGYAIDQPLWTDEWQPAICDHIKPDQIFKGGPWMLGAERGKGFVFDNEKWGHVVNVAPFEIEMQPLTNAEFLNFVNDGGYHRPEFWDVRYYTNLQQTQRFMPAHWRDVGGRISTRWFGKWQTIEIFAPILQISAYEAEAFCRWSRKRLPTEAEWEYAASNSTEFEWGDRVWEWTATPFAPYPGFEPDPCTEYSVPCFGQNRVVRGGSFATPKDLINPKFRNFMDPRRDDLFVGFRVCQSVR